MIIRYLEGTTVRQVHSPSEFSLDEIVDLLTPKRGDKPTWYTFPTEAGDIAIPIASLVSIQE